MTTPLMKQYCVKWVHSRGGSYVPGVTGMSCGYYEDVLGTDFIMATSRKHAIAILREARGQSLQIKSCTNTDTLKNENT